MKILHTADWHLGDRLGRTDDLRRAVECFAGKDGKLILGEFKHEKK